MPLALAARERDRYLAVLVTTTIYFMQSTNVNVA